jgi:PAS domain S-box-containing protein
MRPDPALERYSATVRILGDGVAVLDADGIVRSLNPAGEKLLGASQEQIVGQRLLSVPWRTLNEDGTDRPREEHPAHAPMPSASDRCSRISWATRSSSRRTAAP